MTTRRFDGLRLLVVEDDAMVRRVVVRVAEEMGAVVDAAADGREALHRLGQSRYDVLVTDLKMPGVTGMDLLRFVGEHHAGTGLVAITGYAELEDEDALRRAGAVLLLKPFGNDKLAGALEQALRSAAEGPAGA